MIGQVLSRYRILSELGGGGMGVVYEAEDLELGRRVAIKVLPEETATSPEAIERFQREARAASALNHPHICTVFDAGEHGGRPFLVMERMQGETLKHSLEREPLPFERVLELGAQVADALVAAHEIGIVHRDLKPANLFLTEHGEIKVLDFGLAKLSGPVQGSPGVSVAPTLVEHSLTRSGMAVGTVAYMSPEQACGESVDARSDLFSLGAVLYEMLTGSTPFPGQSVAEIFASLLRASPPPPSELLPDLPPRLDEILLRALEKDPEMRYQHAADLRSDLRRLLRDSTAMPAAVRSDLLRTGPAPARSRRGLWIAGAAGLALVAGALWLGTRERGVRRDEVAPAGPASGSASIAVLPFVNLSSDPEQEYFSDGLAEELLNLLAKIPELRVAARTSAFSFKGQAVDVPTIARRLHVAHVLEGSVRKSGGQVRITAQLVQAEDGYHVWSETYERRLDDVFQVQDEIAAEVVRALRVRLLDGGLPKRSPPRVVESYSLVLKARYFSRRRTREDARKAFELLDRALDLDADYAPAWEMLSNLHAMRASSGWADFDEAMNEARRAAERALELDPGLASAHGALGWILLSYDWDWRGADAAFQRELELDPNNALALSDAGVLAWARGRFDEAVELHERAIERDPVRPVGYTNLGFALLGAKRYEEAEAAFRQVLELSPDSAGGRYFLAKALLAQGRAQDALAELEGEPDEMWRRVGLALAHESLGHSAESAAELAACEERFAERAAYQIAEVHALRGDADAAFAWLERAVEQRDSGLMELRGDPLFEGLAGDPRFAETLARIERAG